MKRSFITLGPGWVVISCTLFVLSWIEIPFDLASDMFMIPYHSETRHLVCARNASFITSKSYFVFDDHIFKTYHHLCFTTLLLTHI